MSLANERTLLAWTRTALALIASGVAATQLPLGYDMTGGRRLIGLPVIGLGASVAVASQRRWREREAAILAGSPLPPSRMPQLLTFGVVAVAVVAALVVASGRGS